MSKPGATPPSLSFAMGLPPKDAIAYFESKGYQVTFNWRDIWQDAQAKAFTVSSVARMDVLEDIRGALTTALKEGKTEAWFAKELTPVLQEKGWWGRRIDVDPDGRARVVRMGSPARLKLIYRQNLQTAYMAGRYKQQLENADNRPWWTYVSVLDAVTTSGCRGLDGLTFRFDDPFWDSHYPPNHFSCRGRVRAGSDRDLERRNITPQSGEGNIVTRQQEYTDPDSGEISYRDVLGYRMPDGRTHYTAPGFSYNPGRAAFGMDMELARKLSLVQDTGLRGQVIQAMNNSPLRQAQFARQVDAVLDSRRAGKSAMAVGLVDEDIAAFVRAQGHDPSRLLVLPEKQLLHADRAAHHAHGIALTREQYRMLPQMIAQPERVLWDLEHQSVVYVYIDAQDVGRRVIIPVEMPAAGKRLRTVPGLDAVVNAYSTLAEHLEDIGRYTPIK